jgi:hypothetical protein
MATTGPKVRKLEPKAEQPEAHKGPEVVINLVEVTVAMSAPFMFGVPLRLVNRLLERFGVVTKEALAEVVEPGFEAKERKAAATRHPSAAKVRTTGRTKRAA